MKMWDLFDKKLFKEMHEGGYIRRNFHPTLDLAILNYTEKAQFENLWNDVTSQCRGLIINGNYDVIARPFDKFHNFDQDPANARLMDQRVEVTDKLDGSLGILWNYQGQQGIATRGSFISDQAIHATEIWNTKYGFSVADCWTYLFEIVYPQNRVVLDYGDLDDLILLGVRDITDGSVVPAEHVHTWRGPRTTTYPFSTLSEALAAPPRANAEGYVVYFPDLDYRLKIKQDDYKALHKIVTGLTKRRIWESMKEGKTLFDLLDIVPDEWHDWLSETHDEIYVAYCQMHVDITNKYEDIRANIPKDFSKTDFNHLLSILEIEDKGMMFALFEGISISDTIWKRIKPEAD